MVVRAVRKARNVCGFVTSGDLRSVGKRDFGKNLLC